MGTIGGLIDVRELGDRQPEAEMMDFVVDCLRELNVQFFALQIERYLDFARSVYRMHVRLAHRFVLNTKDN